MTVFSIHMSYVQLHVEIFLPCVSVACVLIICQDLQQEMGDPVLPPTSFIAPLHPA